MTQSNVLTHLTSRIKADIEFLVTEGLMSRYDADIVVNKLPSAAADNDLPQISRLGLASPPNSIVSTPTSERVVKKAAPPPPPAAPVNTSTPQAKALWGYNEDDSVSFDVSQIKHLE
jgi:LAS seventeen-binding protein 1/2